MLSLILKKEFDRYIKQYRPFYEYGLVPVIIKTTQTNLIGFYSYLENKFRKTSIILKNVDEFKTENDLIDKIQKGYIPETKERNILIDKIIEYYALASLDPKKFPNMKEDAKIKFFGIPIKGKLASEIHLPPKKQRK